jgi:predicted lipoprotein with Yx(FWY)xxD motif
MNRTRLSATVVVVFVAAAIAAIVLITGSSTTKAAPRVAANSAISVAQTPVGNALTDANGRTLYLFAGDRPNVSTLSPAGRAFWPPFTASTKLAATAGVLAGKIGAVAGTTGPRQVTYNGHPLYYFVGDHKPGQIAGQGLNQFGARWYVLSTAGNAITSTHQTTSSAGGGSGNGY